MFYRMIKFRLHGHLGKVDREKFDEERDFEYRFSFAMDILNGLSYIHSRHLIHGRLNSSNCVVDQRLTIKITGKTFVFSIDLQSI